MDILSACVSVCHLCAWHLQRPDKGIRSPGSGITDGCDWLCGCWELKLSPLEEQQALLSPSPFLKTGFLRVALAVLELVL